VCLAIPPSRSLHRLGKSLQSIYSSLCFLGKFVSSLFDVPLVKGPTDPSFFVFFRIPYALASRFYSQSVQVFALAMRRNLLENLVFFPPISGHLLWSFFLPCFAALGLATRGFAHRIEGQVFRCLNYFWFPRICAPLYPPLLSSPPLLFFFPSELCPTPLRYSFFVFFFDAGRPSLFLFFCF